MASTQQSSKDLQKSVKETLKTYETAYKSSVREAEKKCEKIRKEAEKEFEREKAIIKGHKDAKDKAAKDELALVKQEAKDLHTHLVMVAVRDAILDLKTRNVAAHGELSRTSSISSAHSGQQQQSSTAAAAAALAKEEAEVKEWIEIAAEKLEMHMSRSITRQKILEEVASGALLRQYQAQQEAERRTQDLERQIAHLQMVQQQHQANLQRTDLARGDVPPPAYVPVNIGEEDFSRIWDKK
ncbi:hypothetical protein FBU30_008149 [Linnemannia zychae]|nr:hypothetical protein FBU30_008149 [Linnemannia zychae]